MKKLLFLVLNILFILNVKASTSLKTYDEALSSSKTYINSFKDNDKYIIEGSGNLLKENDFLIGKDYLYNGLNFWIISNNTSEYSIIDPIYKNNNYINNTLSKTDVSGIRVVVSAQNYVRVSGEGTRLNPWEFTKRQYEAKIIAENGTVATTPIYIIEGQNKNVSVTANNGYAYDSVSCTNDQVGVYEDGKLKIKSIANNTVCTVKFVNPSKEITYKEEEQEYEVKYDGYYKIDAYGAQGKDSISGKGGHTSGVIYLNKGAKIKINTGGQNGYNGGGSGYYNGGGATTIKISNNDIMIAAGGGGGQNGEPGGNGDSSGGLTSGGAGKYSGGGAAGDNGTNQGGGGSGYDYTYTTTYDDCKTGSNTCKGGQISKNCSSCYKTECVSGTEEYDCDDCASTRKVCKGGYDTVCNTCTYYTTTCPDGWTYKEYTNSIPGCKAPDDFYVYGTCQCSSDKTSVYNCTNQECLGKSGFSRVSTVPVGYSSSAEACKASTTGVVQYKGTCRHEAAGVITTPPTTTGANCSKCGSEEKYDSCKTQEDECVRECKTRTNSCLTTKCVYGCDSVYSECASGSNTCKGGWNYATTPYNSGKGGSNVLSDLLKETKSESGTNSGNGKVKIEYYKESL